MYDKPIEWFNTLGESGFHKVMRILFIVLAVIMAVFFFFLLSLIPLILFAACVVFAIVFRMFAYVEYSFILVDDQMNIAVVYNKSRRRKKWMFRLDQVERIGKQCQPIGEVHALCKADDENQYTLVVHLQEERTSFILDPDPEFLEVMKKKRLLVEY